MLVSEAISTADELEGMLCTLNLKGMHLISM